MGKVGFLDDADLEIFRGDEKNTRKKSIRAPKTFTCQDCGLNLNCQSPKMSVYGRGLKKILIVLDTPSLVEDENGEPWSGITGQLVKELLKDRLGLSVKRDCWTVYGVRCCAKKNIKSNQCEACRKYLHQDIEELKPDVIIPMGYWPMMSVSGDLLNSKSRGKTSGEWAGFIIPDQRFAIWIAPTYDLYLLGIDSQKPDRVRIEQFVLHIDNAINRAQEQVKRIDYNKKVEVITDNNRALAVLNDILDRVHLTNVKGVDVEPISLALDYETTGRKPHRPGHKIITIALSDGKRAWAFPYDPTDKVMTIVFRSLLRHKKINWRVHNLQFEWLWSYNKFGEWPANLEHDTILGVHVLSSQKRKGLKPNVYCIFGVPGYDDNIEDFIKASKKEEDVHGANGFNIMDQAPLEDVLLYNGLDALFTYRLADYVDDNILKRTRKGYKFLMESAINLVKAQENGIRVDTSGTDKARDKLTTNLHYLEHDIQKLAIRYGWQKGTPFRPSASADISNLLFTIMGYETDKLTPTGAPSTDKEALEGIKDPIVPMILDWKRLQKLRDTYLNGLTVEVVNDLIHCFFNLYTVVTFRSSSDAFNFQNLPKRDKESSKIIRDLLFPHWNQKLNEYDYKAIEVGVSACYNQDTNLIKYVSDPSTDMHKDTGIELYMYEDNPGDFSKFDRNIAKNKFVFPEFYGSYFEQVAPDLWNYCSKEAKANLKAHGVRHLSDFTDHVREIERSFWEDRFPEYTQWKKDIYKFYLSHGYVDSYTGFRYYGPMSKNEVLNICIQGSAHHVLLRTFNKISNVIRDKKLKSKMIGQIHDSMIPSVEPEEESYLDKMIWYYGTQEILDDFKWIIVPLSIEKSEGKVNRPWSELEEVGLLAKNGKVLK
jgi:uracil-DNA glycosylase family 4